MSVISSETSLQMDNHQFKKASRKVGLFNLSVNEVNETLVRPKRSAGNAIGGPKGERSEQIHCTNKKMFFYWDVFIFLGDMTIKNYV